MSRKNQITEILFCKNDTWIFWNIEIVWPNIKCPVCLKSLKTTQSLYQIWSETFHFVVILGIKKPYKDKSGKAFEEDRLVAAQPLMFGSTFNVRKLNNLPYHRIKAEQIEALKTECLYNFKFIFCKLLATSCRYMFKIFLYFYSPLQYSSL